MRHFDNTAIRLAVVIPAYKKTYFDATLNSLVNQTNKNFNVYIGDDYSPDNLKEIADRYKNELNITYYRFEHNIGSKDIVNQWTRCINLSKGEQWIWLFSDDDIADKNCVEQFYLTEGLKKEHDVYRFNTVVIDSEDKLIYTHVPSPEEETSEEMAYYLLKGKRGNSMPDHIFSRDIFNKHGIVYTAYAQAADWATSILFSKDKGMCVIPGAVVYWRYSKSNISSIAKKRKGNMLQGHIQFIKWALDHFLYLKSGNSIIEYDMIVDALKENLTTITITHYKGANTFNLIRLYNIYHNKLNLSTRESIIELMIIKKETSKLSRHLINLITSLRKR